MLQEFYIAIWFFASMYLKGCIHDFEMQACYLHLFLHGPKTVVKFQDFFGQRHLDVLKSQMETERERVREWYRRREQGERQIHRRVSINIA